MSPDNKDKLRMTFDPLVIDDLGAKLYSTLPPIISELIANGYDACATEVYIDLSEVDNDKLITVTDNGSGMSFEEVRDKYLKIGRKKRDEDGSISKCGRLPIGKKGLGKLAFFGIAKKALIETIQDGEETIFEMDWKKIQDSSGKKEYEPDFKIQKTSRKNGTKIVLSDIDRKSDFDTETLKKSMSNYFIFDKEFKVFIKSGESTYEEIDNEIRYQQGDRGEDFSWSFPEVALNLGLDKKYPFAREVKGKIILFNKPVRNNLRGVTLFSRKKLVSIPEFFPIQGSSHFFQYLTGWLEIDFIDEFKPDVIATNRSSLNWNDENLEPLRCFLEEVISHIHGEWRKLIKERTKKEIKDKYQLDTEEWKETNKNNPTIVKNIDKVINLLNDPENIEEGELRKVIDIVLDLAPKNADFVLWRNLHKNIKDNPIIKIEFERGDYLQAAKEAVQIYNEAVQSVSGYLEDGYDLMEKSFGKEHHKIVWITDKSTPNEENIDQGQKLISQGVIVGFKNPAVSHTSRTRAQVIREFSDRNCLDILSTISYLFDRLENRKKPI